MPNEENDGSEGFNYQNIFDNPGNFNLFALNEVSNSPVVLEPQQYSHFFDLDKELIFGDRILGGEQNLNDNCAEIVAALIGVDASLIKEVDLIRSNGDWC